MAPSSTTSTSPRASVCAGPPAAWSPTWVETRCTTGRGLIAAADADTHAALVAAIRPHLDRVLAASPGC